MTVSTLPPELQQHVIRIAREADRAPADVLADMVAAAVDLDDDQSLWAAVAESDAEFARGEGIPHEQVAQEMQAIIDRARAQRG
jgi:predicted transcriptional regulator